MATTTTPGRIKKSTNVRPIHAPWLRVGIGGMSRVAPELTARVLADLVCTPRPRRPPAPHGFRGAERFTFDHEGRALAAWSWGSGPTVLLVHGWAGVAAQLRHVVEPLVARGHHVVAFDGPAHGHSEGRTTNLGDFARAVASASSVVGGVHGVIAHSMGGAATTLAMSRYGLAAERLVFVAPPANPGTFFTKMREMLDLSEHASTRLMAEVERRARVPLDEVDAVAIARGMKTPLLLVHDDTDREVPHEASRAIAEAWPGAELFTTTGLGHNRILRDAQVIDAAVRFISDDPAASHSQRKRRSP